MNSFESILQQARTLSAQDRLKLAQVLFREIGADNLADDEVEIGKRGLSTSRNRHATKTGRSFIRRAFVTERSVDQ